MITLKITEDSIARLAGRFDAVEGAIQQSVARQMAVEMKELNSIVKQDYLSGQYFKRRTGNLSRSGMSSVTESGSTVTGQVQFGAEAPYAKFLSGGTRAHGPVRAKVLVFQIDGRTIFAKFVRGIQGKQFLYDAFNAQKTEIVAGLQTALAAAVNGSA